MRPKDWGNFLPANGGCRYAAMMGYEFSAAWAWMAGRDDEPTIIMYSDI